MAALKDGGLRREWWAWSCAGETPAATLSCQSALANRVQAGTGELVQEEALVLPANALGAGRYHFTVCVLCNTTAVRFSLSLIFSLYSYRFLNSRSRKHRSARPASPE